MEPLLDELIQVKHKQAIPVMIGNGKIFKYEWETYKKGDFIGTCWFKDKKGIIIGKYNLLWLLKRLQITWWTLWFAIEGIWRADRMTHRRNNEFGDN